MKSISIIAKIRIKGDIKDIFQYIVPIDLNLIFKKKGLIPGVKSTSNIEKWYKAGMTRTVFFDDNNTALERLESVKEYESFSYEITDFTSILKNFVSKINGEWKFHQDENDYVSIIWEYCLTPKNIYGSIIIKLFIKANMNAVLKNALQIIKENYGRNVNSIR